MTLLKKLRTQSGVKSSISNRGVADECVNNPDLLSEIADGLVSDDHGIISDCAEVMTMVAEVHPELIIPFADGLVPLLDNPKTQARWESMHALALIASYEPDLIKPSLGTIEKLIETDWSAIVVDWGIKAVGNYASTGKKAARAAWPILKKGLDAREGRHTHHALNGMAHVAKFHPYLSDEIEEIAENYIDHKRGVFKKAARSLLRRIDNMGG